jgi:predicted type IV restriction endonuclease
MNDADAAKLRECIRDVAAKIRRFQDRGLGEQNTKASLVEPVLEALGWDVRDPDEVTREFKPTSRDSPVDYALTVLRKPRLFVEAKGLGETLQDRKWIAQVLGYATVAGVEWCVLTDGDQYRLYNATAPLDAEEKLFCSVRLSTDDASGVARVLLLLTRQTMEENRLEMLWNAHFVDRRVKHALKSMISTTDKALIRLVRSREPKLAPKDIQDSLRRLDIRIESATPVPETIEPNRKRIAQAHTRRRREANPSRPPGQKAHFGITLIELIKAKYLQTPLPLFRKYKGRVLEATLHPDGTVEFQLKRYPTCSTAAEIARGSVTGRRMNTNGWSFWQYRDGHGKTQELIEARRRYLEAKGQG